MDRKTELEAKKAKLEQMRREKAQKMMSVSATQSTPLSTTFTGIDTLNVDPDKILIECGITTPVLTSNTSHLSSLTASATSLNNYNEENNGVNGLQHHHIPGLHSKALLKNKKSLKLAINQVNSIDIPPKENVTYSKETQTPATEVTDKDAKPLDYYVLTYDDNDEDEATSLDLAVSSMDNKSTKSTQNKQRIDPDADDLIKRDDLMSIDDRLKQFKDMSIDDNERQKHMESEEFLSFFTRNTRILEKALEQDDIFFEYGAGDKNNEIVETGQVINLDREFSDERSRNRIVTWLDWSPHVTDYLYYLVR